MCDLESGCEERRGKRAEAGAAPLCVAPVGIFKLSRYLTQFPVRGDLFSGVSVAAHNHEAFGIPLVKSTACQRPMSLLARRR